MPAPPTAHRGFDYDAGTIATRYAAGRRLRREQTDLWSRVLEEEVAGIRPRRIVDLGCGIGRFSGLLRDLFGGSVCGVDVAERMLGVAAADPQLAGIRWVRATAAVLPFRPRSVDLIFAFLVYHHLADPGAVLRESARVLADRAAVVIVNSTVETLDSYVWLPFFPSARAIDQARLPSRAAVAEASRAAGLTVQGLRTVLNPVAESLRVYAERIASRTISTLELVPDAEFARGVEEFRAHCAREDHGQPVMDPIDVFILRKPTPD